VATDRPETWGPKACEQNGESRGPQAGEHRFQKSGFSHGFFVQFITKPVAVRCAVQCSLRCLAVF